MKLNDIATIVIKTYERPQCLDTLLKSIRQYYSDITILVCDDSKKPYPEISEKYNNVIHLTAPHYSGVSVGKNILIDNTTTPYIIFLDDDFIFINTTKLELLVQPLIDGVADLCGGNVIGFPQGGKMFIPKGKTLQFASYYNTEETYPIYDFVVNFFAAKTDTLKHTRYDDKLKTGEHSNFFYRYSVLNKYKVTKNEKVFIDHKHLHYQGEGNTHRGKALSYLTLWLKEHGFDNYEQTNYSR